MVIQVFQELILYRMEGLCKGWSETTTKFFYNKQIRVDRWEVFSIV